ncbi:MAG: PilN domain-containing protein [Candidatus Daviesbacteria bacterium]
METSNEDSEKNLAKRLLKNTQQSFFKVNLLIFKEEQPKFHIKLLRWMLSSGRFIVVFVEILTISAFVYRYKLDSDLLDLQEKIKEGVPYIQSLKKDEDAIRQTQFQLKTIKEIKNASPNFAAIYVQIAKLIPVSIKLTNINLDRSQSFSKTNITISGQTPSNLELSAFIKALKSDPTFTNINLTNISFEGETTFTITGSLAEKGAKNS